MAVAFFAERALHRDYERSALQQLAAIARIAKARPPQIPADAGTHPEKLSALQEWVAQMSSSGARVTIIAQNGQVLADSESDPRTMENHGQRAEIVQAFDDGEGSSTRHSVTLNRDLMYYAVRQQIDGAPVILRFAMPLENVNEIMVSFRRSLWLASLVILVLAAGASLLVSRGFSERVDRLKEFSRRVAEGDFRPLPGDGSGDALEALGASLNQTAARLDQTIQTLTEERNLSAAILGSMVEGVAVVNSSERLAFANQSFAGILGLDAPLKPGSAFVETARQTELIEAIRRVLGGEARVEAEISTGTLRQHYFAATVAAVRAGAASGAVVVLHDITDLRKLERVRRDFVANVSHEFKTPLTAIQGFAETLQTGAKDDPLNRERFLGIIVEHARRLARLTDDLLRLSQMDADRLELEVERSSVIELVESCLETARHRAIEKEINISVHLEEALPDIAADQRRLAEVLQNLLDNAIQYTLSRGKIDVRAQLREAEVIFSVTDTGIGIPKADQPRIFERFYRVDAARSREAGRTGLGLSIARHLVEVHGGRLWVESEVGQGSQFYFSVPVFDPERVTARASAGGGVSGRGSAGRS